MKQMQRVISVIMLLAMLFSNVVPAYAYAEGGTGGTAAVEQVDLPETSAQEIEEKEESAPSGEATAQTSAEAESPAEASLSYTFASDDDYFMLRSFLSDHGIYTVAVDYAEVDSDAVELRDYIGDYMVLPLGRFDSATLTAYTREGETYGITLHYPVPAPYEQTLEVELPEELTDTELTLTGLLPDGAEVTVEVVEPAVEGENVLLALDISIEDFQPEQPILVTLSDPTIAAALAEGKELNVVHTDDDGRQELAELVSAENDTIKFKAPHFSQFDLVSSEVESIASWEGDGIGLAMSGYGVTATETTVAVDEGIELLRAYEVSSNLVSRLNVKLDSSLELGDLESLDVYSIEDGKLGSVVENLNHVDGSFALVRDSGLRRDEKIDGAVSVSGMMPKDATLAAEDLADKYAVFSPAEGSSADVFAAYDISIRSGDREYEPDTALQVSIAVETDRPVKVWHLVDGKAVEMENVTVKDGAVSFMADSFSPYLVTSVLTTTITASDGNTYRITVTYDESAEIDEEAKLRVSELSEAEHAEYLARTAEALDMRAEEFAYARIFDIKIVGKLSDTEYEPAAPVEVTIEMLDAYADSTLDVVHFGAGEPDVYNGTEAGNSIRFTTDSFSIYVVASTARYFYTFVNDDGLAYNFDTDSNGGEINFQILLDGDTLKNPAIPTSIKNPSYEFIGWYVSDAMTRSGNETDGYSYQNVGAKKIAFHTTGSNQETDPIKVEKTKLKGSDETKTVLCFVDEDGISFYVEPTTANNRLTVELQARYSNQHTVIYWDEKDPAAIVRTDMVEDGYMLSLLPQSMLETLTDPTEVDILNKTIADGHYTIYTPNNPTEIFLGWSKVQGQKTLNGNSTTVDDTINLYPVIAPAYWIFYDTVESGATYIGGRQWASNKTLVGEKMPVPQRSGYIFGGWYTGKDGSGKQITDGSGVVLNTVKNATGINTEGETVTWTDNDGKITQDNVKLYAKWEATSANYTVVFWVQSSYDAVDLNDNQKTYNYYGAVVRSDKKTGETAEPLSKDQGLASAGFTENGVTIKALGTYFKHNTNLSDDSVKVANDGTSVLNVYYDRKVVTFQFRTGSYSGVTQNNYSRQNLNTDNLYWGTTDGSNYIPLNYYKNDDGTSGFRQMDGTSFQTQRADKNGKPSSNGSYINVGTMGDVGRYSSGTLRYTIKGLYEAPITTFPYAPNASWTWNGMTYTIPWNYFKVEGSVSETFSFTLGTNTPAVTIHYMGEELIYPSSIDTDGTYFQHFTNNPWVYFGKYYDETKAQAIDDPTKSYNREKNEADSEQLEKKLYHLYAYDLQYTEIGQDQMGGGSGFYPDVEVFEGYEIAAITVNREYDASLGTEAFPTGSNGLDNPVEGKWYSTTENHSRVALSSNVKDVYVYLTRVRYNVDMYSDYTEIKEDGTAQEHISESVFHATLPYGLNLYPVRIWNPTMIGLSKQGYTFGYWCWDRSQQQKIEWDYLAYYNPQRLTVPANGVSVFAKWIPQEFVVELDFNGGETNWGQKQDTTFWLPYDATISQYANIKRDYILKDLVPEADADAQLYRYHHFIYVEDVKRDEDGNPILDAAGNTIPGEFLPADQSAFFGALHSGVVADSYSTYYAPKKAEYYKVSKDNQNQVQNFWADGRHKVSEDGYPVAPNSLDTTYYDNGVYVKIGDGEGEVPTSPYRLVGWYQVLNKATGELSDYPYNFTLPVHSNVTLRAVWVREGTFKLKYQYNTAAGEAWFYDRNDSDNDETAHSDANAKQYIDQAIAVAPPAPTDIKYPNRFIGWELDGKVYYPGESFRISMDQDRLDGTTDNIIVLTAVYSDITKASLNYDGNGGNYSGTDAQQKGNAVYVQLGIAENEEIELLKATDFTREGYVLVGWSTEKTRTAEAFSASDNENTDFDLGAKVAVNSVGMGNTLYAVWERTYTLVYHPNEGGGDLGGTGEGQDEKLTASGNGSWSLKGIRKNADGTVTAELTSAEFSRDGYIFAGWNTVQNPTEQNPGESYTTAGETVTFPTEGGTPTSLTLYAQWTPKYSITYHINRGTGKLVNPDGITLTFDGNMTYNTGTVYTPGQETNLHTGAINANGQLLRLNGYRLSGWNTDPNGNGEHYELGQNITVTENLTLYAEWERLLIITYDANGGAGTLGADDGGSYTYPNDSQNDGDMHALTPSNNQVSGIRRDSKVKLSEGKTFTRAEYKLVGWNDVEADADNGTIKYALGGEIASLTGDMTLYAVWEQKLQVIYNVNDSDDAKVTGSLSGLTSAAAGTNRRAQFTTGRIFEKKTDADLNTHTVHNEKNISRPGYQLIGWSTESGRAFGDFNSASNSKDYAFGDTISFSTIEKDVTLYAVWQPLCTLTYDLNGGELKEEVTLPDYLTDNGNGSYSQKNVPSGDSVDVINGADYFTNEGYRFDGWYTKADGSGEKVSGSYTVAKNTTLYAKWVKTWTVTYYAEGNFKGSWSDDNKPVSPFVEKTPYTVYYQVLDAGKSVPELKLSERETPTGVRLDFKYWSESADDSAEAFDFTDAEMKKDYNLYAIYSRQVQVTFNGNGNDSSWNPGTGYTPGDTDQIYTRLLDQGASLGTAPAAPTREGLMFLGWAEVDPTDNTKFKGTDFTLTTTDWSDKREGSTYTNDLQEIQSKLWNFSTAINEDVTLAAVWSQGVKVTFHLGYEKNGDSWTSHHTWNDDHKWGTTNELYYVTDDSGFTYSRQVPKGTIIPAPKDPTPKPDSDLEKSTFLYWVENPTYDSKTTYAENNNAEELNAHPGKENGYGIFDFGTPVKESIILYTSWTNEEVFTFEVKNTVSDISATGNEEFEYIAHLEGKAYSGEGDETGTALGQNGEGWSFPVKLKDGESFYLVINTQVKNDGTYTVIPSLIYADGRRASLPNILGDGATGYDYTVSVTQKTDGYKTTVTGSNPDITVNDDSLSASFSNTNANDGFQPGTSVNRTVTYSNTNTPPSIVTFQKEVKSEFESDKTRDYTFTATLYKRDGVTPITNYKVFDSSVSDLDNDSATPRFTTDNNGRFTFTLKYKESTGAYDQLSVKLPAYARLLVEENVSDQVFTTTVEASCDGKINTSEEAKLLSAENLTVAESSLDGALAENAKVESKDFVVVIPSPGATDTVKVTNSHIKTEVTVEKKTEDPLKASDYFTFQATLTYADNTVIKNWDVSTGEFATNGTTSDNVTDADGKVTFTLQPDEKNVLKVPAGAVLTVTETKATETTDASAENILYRYTTGVTRIDGSTSSGRSYSFTVPAKSATATFTNTRRTVDVTVTKEIANGTPADQEKTFSFTATVKYADRAAEDYDANDFADGVKSFSIVPNQTNPAEDNPNPAKLTVPVGAVLEITEDLTGDDGNRYTVSASGVTGGTSSNNAYSFTVPGANSAVTFTNTRNTVKVVVSNLLDDPWMRTGAEHFTYTALLTDKLTDGTDTPVPDYPIYGAETTGGLDATTPIVIAGMPTLYSRLSVGEYEFSLNAGNDPNSPESVEQAIADGSARELTIPYGATLTVTQASTEALFLEYTFATPYWTYVKASNGKFQLVNGDSITSNDYKLLNNALIPVDATSGEAPLVCVLGAEASGLTAESTEITFKNERKVVPVYVDVKTEDTLNPNRVFDIEGTVTRPSGDPLVYYPLYQDGTEWKKTNDKGYVNFTMSAADEPIKLMVPVGAMLLGRETNAGLYNVDLTYTGIYMDNGYPESDDYPIDWYLWMTLVLPQMMAGGSPAREDQNVGFAYPPSGVYFPWITFTDGRAEYESEVPPWTCHVRFVNTKPYVETKLTKEVNDPLKAGSVEDFYFLVETFQINGISEGVDKPTNTDVNYWTYTTPATEDTSAETATTYKITKISVSLDDDGTGTGTASVWLPTGAKAVITELDPECVNTTPQSETVGEGDSAKTYEYYTLKSDLETAKAGDLSFATTVRQGSGTAAYTNSATINNVQAATNFTFSNTRLTVPVKIVKVDGDGKQLSGALFELTEGSHLPGGQGISTMPVSMVYDGTLYRGADITLKETTVPVNYAGPSGGTVTIKVAPDGKVTVDGDGNTVEKRDGVYTVNIKNTRYTHTLTVSKTLDDVLADSGAVYNFYFRVTLKETDNGAYIGGYPVDPENGGSTEDAAGDGQGSYEFTLSPTNGDAGKVSIKLTIPEGADVTVEELLTSSDDPDKKYTQENQMYFYDTTCVGAPGMTYSETTRTAVFRNVKDDETMDFTNTRKTATVFGQAYVEDIEAVCDKTHPHEGDHDNRAPFEYTMILQKPDGTPFTYGRFIFNEDGNLVMPQVVGGNVVWVALDKSGQPVQLGGAVGGYLFLKDYSDYAVLHDAGADIDMTVRLNSDELQSNSITVPVGAIMVVTEDLMEVASIEGKSETFDQKERYETDVLLNGKVQTSYKAGETDEGTNKRSGSFTIPVGGGTLTFENRQATHKITVKNEIIESVPYTGKLEYTATLKYAAEPHDKVTVYNGNGFENGEITFSLYRGESKTLIAPVGYELVIEEKTEDFGVTTSSDEFTDGDSTDTSFTISKVEKDGTVTFTNSRESYTGGLKNEMTGPFAEVYKDVTFDYKYQVTTWKLKSGETTAEIHSTDEVQSASFSASQTEPITVEVEDSGEGEQTTETVEDPYTIPLYYWVNGDYFYYQTVEAWQEGVSVAMKEDPAWLGDPDSDAAKDEKALFTQHDPSLLAGSFGSVDNKHVTLNPFTADSLVDNKLTWDSDSWQWNGNTYADNKWDEGKSGPGTQIGVFTNERKTAALTVKKLVIGEMGDRTKDFSFTLTGLAAGIRYSYTIYNEDDTVASSDDNSSTPSSETKTVLDENGQPITETITHTDHAITFTLKHGQYLVITLPTELEYTAAETSANADGYTSTSQMDGEDDATNAVSKTFTLDRALKVTFYNDYPTIAPTAIDFSYAKPFAYILIFGLGLGFLALRGKQRKEEDDGEPPRPCGRGVRPRQGKEVGADGSG